MVVTDGWGCTKITLYSEIYDILEKRLSENASRLTLMLSNWHSLKRSAIEAKFSSIYLQRENNMGMVSQSKKLLAHIPYNHIWINYGPCAWFQSEKYYVSTEARK